MNDFFKIKRMIIMCLLSLLNFVFIYGQNFVLPPVESAPDILSSVFRKNNLLDVDLCMGRSTVNIPLYTYKDQDFELPIKLHYSSGGYRPNEPIGYVGIGWYLDCGGTITRKVNGGPDEGPAPFYNNLFGYYFFYREHQYPVDYDRMLREGGTGPSDLKHMFGWDNSETTPDEFTFDFMGYKGVFYLGADTVYVCHTNVPQGEIKVEVDWDPNLPNEHVFFFKIITGDGYIYTFRNVADTAETWKRNGAGYYKNDKFVGSLESVWVSIRRTPVQMWCLSEVEAPNGRKINYSYKAAESYGMSQRWCDTLRDWDENIGELVFDDSGTRMMKGYLNTVELFFPLDNITIDNTMISFQYTDRVSEKNYSGDLPTISKLSTLAVTNQTGIIKKCNFCYAYPENYSERRCRPVLFLKKVDVTVDGTYSFDYYDENGNYRYIGEGTDLFGYSDGSLGATYPYLHRFDENYVETIKYQEDFESSFEKTRQSMLQRITYPTKGYTKFFYSQNDYDGKVTKDLTHNNEPYLRGGYFRVFTGGVKISKITTYTNDSDSTFRKFDYRLMDSDNTRYESSGILLHTPRFHRIVYDLQGNTIQREFSMRGTFMSTLDNSHITYSQVFEDLPDGSYWHYTFSDYLLLPDLPYNKANIRSIGDWDWNLSERRPLYINEFYAKYDSRHTQRGKLIEKAAYSKTGKLKYVEKYIYDYTKPLSYFMTIANAYSYHYQQKTFIDDYPLVRIEKIYYSEDNSAKQYMEVTRFAYNKLGQIINKEVETSDRKWVSEKSQYVSDIPVSRRTDAQEKMLAMNMLKYPIRTQASISGKGVIDGSYAKYAVMDNGLPVISENWKLETSSPLSVSDFAFDSFLYKENTCQYDNWGRLIGVVDQNGQVTTYVWGWLNILAEVKGASPQTVMAKLRPGKDYRIPFEGSSLTNSQIEALRSIPGSMVTVFAHKELVGVTEMEDTSGRSTFYRYNDDGELIRVEDDRDYKSLEYEYHKK